MTCCSKLSSGYELLYSAHALLSGGLDWFICHIYINTGQKRHKMLRISSTRCKIKYYWHAIEIQNKN